VRATSRIWDGREEQEVKGCDAGEIEWDDVRIVDNLIVEDDLRAGEKLNIEGVE